MTRTFKADLIKGHFIINDDGNRALVDTGCPYIINNGNMRTIPMGELYLNDARRNVDPNISEFRGLEYFVQHKVLFDYKKSEIIVTDQGENLSVAHPVAKFDISGLPHRILFDITIDGMVRKMIFDTGASITNYLTQTIAVTGTPCGSIEDFLPPRRYTVDLFKHSVEIGGETVDIPFGTQPAEAEPHVRATGAVGVIGIGLYEKFQVLIDFPNRKLVLGKFE